MKLYKVLLLTIFSIVTLSSCGSEKKQDTQNKVKFKTETKTTNSSDDGVANIVITGDDYMKFNTNEIRAKAGQKVKLTLRHIGTQDVRVMGHNVVILKEGVNATVFASKAAKARENDYIPVDSKEVIAHTKMIGGKQTTSVEFIAPAAGTYDFICSFPAHFAMMKGKFIVE